MSIPSTPPRLAPCSTRLRDPKALGQRVCFIHTGGIFSLFPPRAADASARL
jgi:hypothetical protein